MRLKCFIFLFALCVSNLKGLAQNYFSNRYDTFGSCDGANCIDIFNNKYITANFTCSAVSFYALNLKLYDFNTGSVSMSKTYNWSGNNFAAGNGIKTKSATFLLCGSRFYKNDTSLVFQWTFDSSLDSVRYNEYGYLNQGNVINKIIYDNMKYLYMVGNVYDSNYNSDILLIKTDTLGNEIWKKKIGIAGVDETALNIDTLNGKLIIAGNINSHSASSTNGFVMYLDTAGNTIWQRTVTSNGGYGGCEVKKLKDGKILIYNRIKKYSIGSNDYYKLHCEKIDWNNNTIWSKEYFPLGESNPYSAIENNDGNIVICGQRAFINNTVSGTIFEINQNGDSLLYREYRILPNSQNYFRDVIQAPDKGYCFSGFVSPMNGDGGTQDIWLLKVDSNLCESATACITGNNFHSSMEKAEVKLYPNPASSELFFLSELLASSTVTVDLFDVQGRLMIHSVLLNSNEPHKFDVNTFTDGVYFYRITGGNEYLKTGKIVIVK